MTPLIRARQAFFAAFGRHAELSVQAPGRVNLIGGHTDYNDGFVLPCAIDFHTVISGSARKDRRVRVLAVDYSAALDEFSLEQTIVPLPDRLWANYVRGVVKYLLAAGHALTGADLAVSSNVPQGAGLSSSASLEVAAGQFFKSLNGLTIDRTALARIGQQAENHFVGCNCGIMDQLISARGTAGHALLIDCRSLATRAVASAKRRPGSSPPRPCATSTCVDSISVLPAWTRWSPGVRATSSRTAGAQSTWRKHSKPATCTTSAA